MTCTRCGATSAGTVTDPDTGETVLAWWCPACGADLVRQADDVTYVYSDWQ